MPLPVRLSRTATKLVFSALVCSMALGIGACSGKPENSPVIRKKFAEMDAVQTDVAEATKTLKAIAGDMTVLKDQMSEIRALSPDPSGTIQAVKRLEELERRLANLDGAVSAAAMASASVPTTPTSTASAPAPAAATTVASVEGPITPVADGAAAALVSKSASVDARPSAADSLKNFNPTAKTTTTAAAAPKAEPAKPTTVQTSVKKPEAPAAKATTTAAKSSSPRGKYYKVLAGDTLETIAKDNKVSVELIRSANKLPSGARPLQGQQLFIPQS